MEQTDSILYQKEGTVAFITLNRPKVYNSFNREMIFALQARLDEVAADQEVRALVITGSGKAFCAGQDLSEVLAASETGQRLDFKAVVDEHYTPVVLKIRHMDKPVVAAVNGTAAGAGANIALACDLVVASESASFIQAFSQIGLIPDSGGTYFLPRLVGRQRAMALMMLGDKLRAPDAKNMGMIYDCYSEGEFEGAVRMLAQRLAEMPTLGLAYTKRLLNQSENLSLEEQLRMEADFQQLAGQTEDYAEGVAAFMEKRPAIFKGK